MHNFCSCVLLIFYKENNEILPFLIGFVENFKFKYNAFLPFEALTFVSTRIRILTVFLIKIQ